jgi:hypothetical protein
MSVAIGLKRFVSCDMSPFGIQTQMRMDFAMVPHLSLSGNQNKESNDSNRVSLLSKGVFASVYKD